MKQASLSTLNPAALSRRKLVQAGGAALMIGTLGAPVVRAQSGPKIRIGYWPIAAGLPFYTAIERGFFKEAGLDVEPLRFAGAQHVKSRRSQAPQQRAALHVFVQIEGGESH